MPIRETQTASVVQAPQGQSNPQGIAPQVANAVVNVNSPQTAFVPPVSIVTHKSRIIAGVLAFFAEYSGCTITTSVTWGLVCCKQFLVVFVGV